MRHKKVKKVSGVGAVEFGALGWGVQSLEGDMGDLSTAGPELSLSSGRMGAILGVRS